MCIQPIARRRTRKVRGQPTLAAIATEVHRAHANRLFCSVRIPLWWMSKCSADDKGSLRAMLSAYGYVFIGVTVDDMYAWEHASSLAAQLPGQRPRTHA